jgi:hypothetical protein
MYKCKYKYTYIYNIYKYIYIYIYIYIIVPELLLLPVGVAVKSTCLAPIRGIPGGGEAGAGNTTHIHTHQTAFNLQSVKIEAHAHLLYLSLCLPLCLSVSILCTSLSPYYASISWAWMRHGMWVGPGVVLVPFDVPLTIGFTGWGLAVLVLLLVPVVLVAEAFDLTHSTWHTLPGVRQPTYNGRKTGGIREKLTGAGVGAGAGAGGGVAFLSCSK